ncbi:MAG: ABC transporter substrate-binding protein [Nocardioidaceae bacterium]
MRAKRAVIVVSTVTLVALAACSGSSGSSNDKVSAADRKNFGQKDVAMDASAKPPAAPLPGAKKGGTITALAAGGNNTMDPTEAYSLYNLSILGGMVTRSLTQYRYNPKTGHNTLIPDLATGLGRHNDDYTKWTFTLRKGVKYENGKPVTPEDIKYGIERSMDRKTFPFGANYSTLFFLNGDTYTGPYRDDKGKDYEGVVIHGRDITIKMSKPFPDMPYWGAFPAMSPIPAGSVSKPSKYRLHPLATGPYKFKSYTPNHSLVLVQNKYWDPDTDPGRRQYVDGYNFKFDVDQNKIDQIMLQDQGSAKTTVSLVSVLRQDYHTFKTQAPDRLAVGSLPCTFMLDPDNRKITSIAVRKALAWAIPYKDIWAAGGAIPGVTRISAENVTPPGVAGRTKYNPLPGHKPATTDPDKAKAILKKAGKLNYTLRFSYSKDEPESVAVKDVKVRAFKEAGFNPQPVATTSDNSTSMLLDPNSDINLRAVEWCPDWPSNGSFIPPVFESTDIKKNGLGSNFAAFHSEAADARMQEIRRMPLAKQGSAWNKLEQTIMKKHFPVIPKGYAGHALMVGSKVHGVDVNPGWGEPTWNRMWVE